MRCEFEAFRAGMTGRDHDLARDLDAAQHAKTAMEREIQQLKQDLDNTTRERNDLGAQLGPVNNELARENHAINEANLRLKDENVDMRRQIQDLISRNAELEGRLNRSITANEVRSSHSAVNRSNSKSRHAINSQERRSYSPLRQ